MADTSRLKMPPHEEPELDGFLTRECGTSRVPGYAQEYPPSDPLWGHLHCNRCGWVTPEKVVLTRSTDTDRVYLTWEDYIAEEHSGWCVVLTSSRRDTVPVVYGPYPTQADAQKARARLRARFQKEELEHHGDDVKVRTLIRPLWKEPRRR